MENAVDALKMAAAFLSFLLALGISISSFSQARQTADILIRYSDREYVTQYMEDLGTANRIVGRETIIPAISRAYKEYYKIYFYDASGNPLELFTITQNGTTGKVGLFVDSEIIGETIPAKADIIGISRNATGQLISPRFKTDIIAKNAPTGIGPSKVVDNVWTDNGTLYLNLQEDATVHIYNVQGKQVYGGNMAAGLNNLSLEQGIYLIKMNEITTKILIK